MTLTGFAETTGDVLCDRIVLLGLKERARDQSCVLVDSLANGVFIVLWDQRSLRSYRQFSH